MARDQVPASGLPVSSELTLTTAGVEQSFDINVPDSSKESVKKIQIRSRTSDALKYGWAPGGPYVTIPKDQTYWDDLLDIRQQLTVYLVGTLNGQVAEIQVWR